jgi:hypothetical protein
MLFIMFQNMCNLRSSKLKHQIKVEGKTTHLIGTLFLTKKIQWPIVNLQKIYRFCNKNITPKRLKIVTDYIEEKVQKLFRFCNYKNG